MSVSGRRPYLSVPSGGVSWCIAGALTDTSFSVRAGVDSQQEAARILVSTNADFSSPAYVSDWTAPALTVGAKLSYRTLSFDVTGLTADTTYYYGFHFKNAPSNINPTRTIKTAPASHTASEFTIVAASCGHIDQPRGLAKAIIHEAIKLEEPLLLLHADDLLYVNPDTTSPGQQRDDLMRLYARAPSVASLALTTPFFWMPGDHDMGPNDSTLDTADAETIYANSRLVYHETTPHYEYVNDAALTQVFDIAKIRFIVLDCMSQSSEINDTGLGRALGGGDTWDQRSWLQTALTQAGTDYTAGTIKWTVIVLPRGWLFYNQTSFVDAFPGERVVISDMIEECACPVLMVTGDTHCVAFEDGTFAGSYATDGFCKFPLIVASALFSDIIFAPDAVDPSYEYTWDGVDEFHPLIIDGVTDGFYVPITFSADNTTWTATCKGTPIDPSTFAPTTISSVASDDVTPEVSFNDASIDASPSSVVTVNLDKTWFGPCSVNWAGNSQSGTVTFKPNKTRATFNVTAPSSGSFQITLSAPVGCTISGSNPATVTIV